MWTIARQKGKFQSVEWLTPGNVWPIILLALALMMLVATLCGLTRLAGAPKAQVMALYTPSSAIFAPRSAKPSDKMPLPWHYRLSPARDLGSLPQAKLGDL